MGNYIASEGDSISLILELPRQEMERVEMALSKDKSVELRVRGSLRLRANSSGNLEVSGSADAYIKR